MLVLYLFSCILLIGQQLAFPEAEGFGKYTTGGRGGDVYEVTNLNDRGDGSLRSAINQTGARTIVFRVSGTIYLESTLEITRDNITIAGQTAPGYGITLANYNFRISADNVIIRYIRSRLGDTYNQEADAFTCTDYNKNIIVDHCSFSWSVDETATSYQNENFTMQWCIISESMYNSVHSKEEHGYGGIWGGSKATYHHNLLAHHTSRNPRFNGARYSSSPWYELVDHRNNVIYNWGFNSAYGGEPSEIDGVKAHINIVKNYYKPGPATSGGLLEYRIVAPDADLNYGFSEWYIDSNYVYGHPEASEDNWLYGVQDITTSDKESIKMDEPFEFDITTIHTAEEAYIAVLDNAGAILPRRDTIDRRVIREVKTGTATYGGTYGAQLGIIDSQEDVGGWPEMYSAYPPVDTDHDGMTDEWEISMGLDINNPDDRNEDHDSDGYTNLEEYLNSITEYPAFLIKATDFKAELTNLNEITLSWTDNNNFESGTIIERNDTGVFVIIDTIPANIEIYTNSGLNYDSEYSYRLKVISLNDSSMYSATSSAQTISQTSAPTKATYPSPIHNAVNIKQSTILSWKKGVGATSHKIYLSINNPPTFISDLSETSYKPDTLWPNWKYYWRVDEVNENGTTKGDVWEFSVRAPLNDNLVGHWQFEGGSFAFDSSEFENHGVYNNFESSSFTWDGAIKRALIFNGIDQYVKVPDSWEFDFESNDFSIAFWLKQDQNEINSSEDIRYIMKGSIVNNINKNQSGKRYEILNNSANSTIQFTIDDNENESSVEADNTNFIAGKWVHITAIREKSKKKLHIYLNGELINSSTDNTGDIAQSEDLYFGYCPETNSYMAASMDDVRFYNYALKVNDILNLVEMGPDIIDTIDSTETSTAISNYSKYNNWNIYPNPFNNNLFIENQSNSNSNITIEIFTISGVIVKNYLLTIENKSEMLNLDLSNIKPGIYYLRIRNKEYQQIQKVIKIK